MVGHFRQLGGLTTETMEPDQTISTLLALASILVPSAVAVGVGWWQVKVMKQLAHSTTSVQMNQDRGWRRRTTSLLLGFVFIAFGLLIPGFNLFAIFVLSKPVDRFDLFGVALNVGIIVTSLCIALLMWGFGLVIDAFKGQNGVNNEVLSLLEKHTTVFERQASAESARQKVASRKRQGGRSKSDAT